MFEPAALLQGWTNRGWAIGQVRLRRPPVTKGPWQCSRKRETGCRGQGEIVDHHRYKVQAGEAEEYRRRQI